MQNHVRFSLLRKTMTQNGDDGAKWRCLNADDKTVGLTELRKSFHLTGEKKKKFKPVTLTMAWDLKNEEEVKQYLENLGTEYRFGCLSEKKPEVCHLLGDFMESIKKDFGKAASLYRSTCDDYHFGRSCHKFATYSLTGKGCQADQPKAFEYFKKGCSLGEADSCLYAGLMCTSNNEKHQVKLDYPQGMGFLNQSCDKGNHNGCYYLSGMYLSGVPNILEKNMTMAYNYSMKACELGNIYACANVSRMYSKGDGVAQNPELASKYKSKVFEMEKEMRGHFKPIEMERGA